MAVCIIWDRQIVTWGIIRKVKQSRNRPGVAQRVPGCLGSKISWHSARKGGEVFSLTHRPPLPPGMILVLILTRGWVDPRALVRSEGNMLLKNPLTPPGIDSGTVRLVAHRVITMETYEFRTLNKMSFIIRVHSLPLNTFVQIFYFT
jgi:hypothetical protein